MFISVHVEKISNNQHLHSEEKMRHSLFRHVKHLYIKPSVHELIFQINACNSSFASALLPPKFPKTKAYAASKPICFSIKQTAVRWKSHPALCGNQHAYSNGHYFWHANANLNKKYKCDNWLQFPFHIKCTQHTHCVVEHNMHTHTQMLANKNNNNQEYYYLLKAYSRVNRTGSIKNKFIIIIVKITMNTNLRLSSCTQRLHGK